LSAFLSLVSTNFRVRLSTPATVGTANSILAGAGSITGTAALSGDTVGVGSTGWSGALFVVGAGPAFGTDSEALGAAGNTGFGILAARVAGVAAADCFGI
jgi:hypothetical protein